MTGTRLCELQTARSPREAIADYCTRLELLAREQHQYSRAELRALPLKWIVFGRPPLAFPTDQASSDAGVHEREIGKLVEQYRKFKELRSQKQLQFTAHRIRRAWVHMLELAEGTLLLHGRWPATMVFRAD
jgi:hypothetical protein